MVPLHISRSVRSLGRVRRIAVVLTQQGFGHIVERIDLVRYVPLWMRRPTVAAATTEADVPLTPGAQVGRRMVRAASALGPTFIKLAQVLTTRPDIVPADVIAELRTLQDQVPPFDTGMAKQIIEEDLHRPLDQCFRNFGPDVLASGSIGQVYRATHHNGDDVIVKVRRPGIDETIRTDMYILRWLAHAMEQYVPDLRMYRPKALVEEFDEILTRELDYVNEASATTRFAEAFADVPHVRCPRVYWDLSSSRVLTLEALPGRNIAALLAENDPRLDRRILAERLADVYYRQLFEIGIFQADPHPGNILVDPPADLNLIDFGQVGLVSEEMMTHLVTMMYAAVSREPEVIADTLADLNAFGSTTDPRRLDVGLRRIIDKYYGLPLKHIDLSRVFDEFSELMRRNDLMLPRELVLMIKALSTVGAIAMKVDPEYNLVASLGPRLKQLLHERFSPARMRRSLVLSAWHLLSTARRTPRQLRHWLRHMAEGTWQLHLRHENLDHLARELDRSSNRLSFAIVIAAIVIGSSYVLTTQGHLPWFDIPLQYLGLAGYVFAAMMGITLVWAIFRSGRLH